MFRVRKANYIYQKLAQLNEGYLAFTAKLYQSAGYSKSERAEFKDFLLSLWPENLRALYFKVLGLVSIYQLNEKFDLNTVLEKIARLNLGSVFAVGFVLIVLLSNLSLILSILKSESSYQVQIAAGGVGIFMRIMGIATHHQELVFKLPALLWAFTFLMAAIYSNTRFRIGLFPLSTSRSMRTRFFPERVDGRYRILMIQPTLKIDQVGATPLRTRYPFTIPYLAALVPANWDVMLIHTVFDKIDYDIDTDVVAITSMALNFKLVSEIAGEFRKRGKTVICGGADPTRCPDKYLRFCNSVLVGAAEEYLPVMLQDWERGQLRSKYINARAHDLKNMPLPRFDLLPLRRYSNCHNILVSTSCPFKCSFCQYNRTREPRLRPVDDVLKNIRATPAKYFWFEAPELLIYKKYVRELESALRGSKIHWASHATMKSCSDETTLKLAYSAGLRSILIGLESFNENTLLLFNKTMNVVSEYQKIFSLLNKTGISVSVHMIFGAFTDRRQDFTDAVQGLIKGKVSLVHVHNMTAFAGDEEFESLLVSNGAVEYDALKKFNMGQRYGLTIYRSPQFSDAEMLKFYNQFHDQFYSLSSIFKRLAFRSPRNFVNFLTDFKDNVNYHIFRRSHGGYSADLFQTFSEFIDEPVQEMAESVEYEARKTC